MQSSAVFRGTAFGDGLVAPLETRTFYFFLKDYEFLFWHELRDGGCLFLHLCFSYQCAEGAMKTKDLREANRLSILTLTHEQLIRLRSYIARLKSREAPVGAHAKPPDAFVNACRSSLATCKT
jgi:hypothetical protein